jgi:putative peptidoglycan lipid II flippase
VSSSNRTLVRAGMIVSGAFLASRILGWVRVVVIGNVFGGESAQLDAFYAAFRIPDLMYQLVAAGALSAALIPMLAELFAADGRDRAWRLVSTIVNLMLIVLAILGALVVITAPWLVETVIAPGFDEPTQALTVDLTRIMVLSATFLALSAAASGVLNARGRFAAAAVAPLGYNLAIIASALLLAPSMGAIGLAIGVVVGAIIHLVVQLPAVRRLGYRWVPRVDMADPVTKRTLALMAPRAIGLGASQITFVVVTALATNLGVGAVTAFTIAFTLLQIPIGVIGVPLGIVLFPTLSREVALGNLAEFRTLLVGALRVIVFVMIPVAGLVATLPTELVALLFPRFSPSAVSLTAATLLAFSFGLVAHALIAVLARSFYARQDTVTPVIAAVLAVLVNTILATILITPLGLPGIGLAIAIAAWLEAATLAIFLWRRVPGLDFLAVGWVGLRTFAATAIASLVALFVHAAWIDATEPAATTGLAAAPWLIVTIALVGAVFGLTFIVAALALRITELRSIVGLMLDALRRPRRP